MKFIKTKDVIKQTSLQEWDFIWCMDGRRMCQTCFNEKLKLLSSLVGYDERNEMKLDPAYELVGIDNVTTGESEHCDWCGNDISSK